jgi:hypothetical protein
VSSVVKSVARLEALIPTGRSPACTCPRSPSGSSVHLLCSQAEWDGTWRASDQCVAAHGVTDPARVVFVNTGVPMPCAA